MARRKITEEAESNQEQDDQDAQDKSDDGDQDSDRTQLTQRMPDELLDDVDGLAEELGMSRNAAINMLVKQGLERF